MLLYSTIEGLVLVRGESAVLLPGLSMDDVFRAGDPAAAVAAAASAGTTVTVPDLAGEVPPPVASQEIWAAGVTYFRSRAARMDESKEAGASVFYDRVYEAARPEIFFKGSGWRARGHRAGVRVRSDSEWSVPEPELVLAVNAAGRIFGFTVGNDMSARDIEGDNPLYLPQAKVYRGSCALGPAILLAPELPDGTVIAMTIRRGGAEVFAGETSLAQLKRSPEELVRWLFVDNEFPDGVLLFTGTGLVPPGKFTLTAGDEIAIRIDGVGTLVNAVER
jgi:2-dehydro-3-deoxy-D-arabinonate dehydratase